MKRREFLKTSALAAVGTAAAGRAERKGIMQPNLLIIHTDEHNFRTLGCYRATLPEAQAYVWGKDALVETPHIDWLAQHGALCTKFYASTPVCSPSRASFVSGLYPQNTPVVVNNIPLDGDIITFAELLRRQGYRTGYIGKWHLDGDGKPQWEPTRRFGFEENRYMYNRGHWKKLTDSPDGPRVDTGENPTYDVTGATPENFTTDWLTGKAIDFMNDDSRRPFCCMVSIPDPHGPDSVRAPYDTQYTGMRFSAPSTASRDASAAPSWARPSKGNTKMAQYFGMVKCIDDNVGRLLEYLREAMLLDNTIVVFTSDHGDLCGEHNRHNKGVPLEASVKVPFVLYYPARVQAGTIVKHALGMPDFLPTILALMGVSQEHAVDGRDASALFTGSAPPPDLKDITFSRGTGPGPNWLAAFTSRYKLVLSPKDSPWLIDMEQDPDELRNVCEDPEYGATAQMLASELLAYGKTYNDTRIDHPGMAKDLQRLASA